jgi:Dolichyl-phosphate-mannose-protein mannosyltransferase
VKEHQRPAQVCTNGNDGSWLADLLRGQCAMSTTQQLLILSVITVLSLLPFTNKAFYVDDPLFVWAGKHIQTEPMNPYNFKVNWSDTDTMMSDVTKNPPIACYYIAGAAAFIGWHETGLHIAFMLPALLVICGTFLLAKHFCKGSMAAALVTLLSPVFLVSATTVMCDVPMLAAWIFAIYFWIRGVDEDSHLYILASALLMAVCALTKYFGMALVPLLMIYAVMARRSAGWWLVYLIIPVAVLYWYQVTTKAAYGRGLLMDAVSFAYGARASNRWSLSKVITGFSFTGGCALGIIFFGFALLDRWKMLYAALGLLVLVIAFWLMNTVGPPLRLPFQLPFQTIFQVALMTLAGLSIIVLAGCDMWRHRNAASLLLLLWVLGTYVFATFVNWSVNGRSILPMMPAVAILVLRRTEALRSDARARSLNHLLIPIILSAAVAFLVTRADFVQAQSDRHAAAQLCSSNRGHTVWFEGHWGFQYYMEAYGAKPFNKMMKAKEAVGDVLIIPLNNTYLFSPPAEWTHLRDVRKVAVKSTMATMQKTSAGFYSDAWGPMPFALRTAIPDEFEVFDIY